MGLFDRLFGAGTASPPAPHEALFDEAFQRKLEMLALVNRRRAAGRLRAERKTRKVGSGLEFADYREYQPGDDFRSLDWNVYQKFDRLLLRLYEEEEDLSVAFVLDTSASMAFGDGRKLRFAKRVLAALSYVALANLDRVSIVTASDRLDMRLGETRGRARIFKVFRFLEQCQAGGQTDLHAALRSFVAQQKRRGLAIVISDFYDPHGVERGINVLRYNKFEPLVVHVVDAAEAQPKLSGDVRLQDAETGESREVTVTPKVLAAYRQAYERQLRELERFCVGREVGYSRADVAEAEDELVLRMLRRGGMLR